MATKKKTVPVTSVTPASKVKAVSKAQQARTRNLVMGIASATPVGRVARGAATVAKAASNARKAGTVVSKLAEPKSAVRIKYNKQAMENAIKSSQSKMKRPDMSPSRPANSALPRPNLVKIDSSIKAKTADQARANARGLRAANKPTKASKTFIGNNNKISPRVRRDIIVNETSPARPNRERGGSLNTLRKQGKTSPTPARKKSK